MKIGLTGEHIEALRGGETVSFVTADLGLPGRNVTVEIEPTETGWVSEYLNGLDLPSPEDP